MRAKLIFITAAFLAVSLSFNASATIGIKKDRRGNFAGFNQEGIDKLKEIRKALKERFDSFNLEFLNLETLHHALTVARVGELNALLYGPPGGAKSKAVEWLAESEQHPAFKIQLHQMMNEQPIVGGQDFEQAKLGKYVLNTDTALANFRVAYIDEMEKGNPATLAALLSLLNERKVLAGAEVVDAKTETIFAMSNANLAEIFAHFMTTGQSTTAAAFLNRFHLKAMVYNWLNLQQQAMLDDRNEQKRQEKAMRAFDSDHECNLANAKAPSVDWEWLRNFANILIVPNDHFTSELRILINEMRSETNAAVRQSEEEVKNRKEPFPYFPSFDYTERLRQKVKDVIIASVMIDFLLSDLAKDDVIEKNVAKAIEMGPLSLWRAHLILTTIGPGEAKLVYNEENDPAASISFGSIDEANLRDERERQLVTNLKGEQKRFSDAFARRVKSYQSSIGTSASVARNGDLLLDRYDVFELLILKK